MKAQDFKIGDLINVTFINKGELSVWKVTVITEKGIQAKRHIEGVFNIKTDLKYFKFKDCNKRWTYKIEKKI